MIEKQWRESIPGRMVQSLGRRYPGSLLGGAASGLGRRYPDSRLCGAVTRFVNSAGTGGGWLAVLFTALNARLYAAGQWFGTHWRTSIFGALVRAVNGLPFLTGGFIMTGLRSFGVRRLLLLAFSLFLPLDWFLRQSFMPSLAGPLFHNGLLLACLLYVLWQRLTKPMPGHYTPIDGPMIFFMGLCVFLLLYNSVNLRIGFAGMRATAQYMLWFFVMSRMIRDKRDWQMIYYTLVMIGTVVAVHGIYQYIVAAPIPANWVTQSEMGVRTRAFSITGSPNIMGDLMAILMPMSVGLAYRKGVSWERKLFWWLCAALQGLACVVTFSRGAWLGLVAAVLVFTLLHDRRLAIGLLCVTGVLVFIPEVMNRVAYLMTSDFLRATQTGGRAGRQETGLYLLRAFGYVFGMGHGMYGGAIAMQNQIIDWLTYNYLDNYYLKTLVETGIAGLGTYLVLILTTMATAFRAAMRTIRSFIRPQVVGIMAGMSAILVHSMFENIFEVPYMNSYFWGLAGMLCVAIRFVLEDEKAGNC